MSKSIAGHRFMIIIIIILQSSSGDNRQHVVYARRVNMLGLCYMMCEYVRYVRCCASKHNMCDMSDMCECVRVDSICASVCDVVGYWYISFIVTMMVT